MPRGGESPTDVLAFNFTHRGNMSEPAPPPPLQHVIPGSTPSPGGVESLSELLCCYICADRLRDASLCPHCSKMGCYTCIQRWVTNNRANCPHCRAPLTESSLIRVPLFDDLRNELEKHPTNPLEGGKAYKERMCSQHKEKVSVYCETCHLCICHDCVLWETSPHKGHSYVKLEVLLQKRTKICEVELRKLQERMKGVLNQVQCVERKMEGIKGSRIKVRREMKDALDKMTERLEYQYHAKQQKLEDVRQKLKGQAMQLTRATREMETKISGGSIACLLNENGDLREDVLQKLHELQSLEIEPIPSIGELFNEMVPSYSTGIFKIHPYMYLKQKGEEVYSKPLHMCGTIWKLKVYPNGHREDTGVYLSAFLELTEGYEKITKYQYCIEMLYNCTNKHPSRNYKKEYVSDFADGESWGYRKFYELSKLESDGFLKDDMVVLRFSVRALTNHQKCRDLTAHIRRLEHKVEGLQRELKARKENSQPPSQPPSDSTSTPANNKTSPSICPRSPSHQRSSRHQHSHSEPISPSPRTRDGGRSPHRREERHGSHSGRQEQDIQHEQERQQHQERRNEQERRYDQERRREGVRRRDRERGFREHRGHPHVTLSQQPTMRNRRQHIPGGSSGYMSQQRHSDSHLVGIEPGQQMAYRSPRRDAGEGVRQHRRLSADPALLQHHLENPISPPTFRHNLAPPPRGEHLHFRHDSVGSATDEVHFGEEFGSQVSLSASPARRTSGERLPRFEEGSGDEGGCSQPHPWGEPISHTDIQISITDGGMHYPSTLTSAQPRHHSHLHLHHGQSQEQCADDEETGRLMASEHMLGGPFSSQQFTFVDPYEDGGRSLGLPTSKCDMPSHTSALSQPTVSKRRLQSSVPDLSLLTGTNTSNLAHSQCLSQSVLEMSRHAHRGDHSGGFRYPDSVTRIAVSSRPASYHSHLNRMPSDPHLNSEGPHHPGLMRTMLARLKEEPEHSPAVHRRRQRGATTAQQPPRRGYREARNSMRRGSSTPSQQQEDTPQSPPEGSMQEVSANSSGSPNQPTSSGSSNPELTPTNPQPPKPAPSPPATEETLAVVTTTTTGSQFLGLAGKSSSNTSLSNLDLI